jgi:hypothetical protein
MKVGDLVSSSISAHLGIIIAVSQRDRQMMLVFWAAHEEWYEEWCGNWLLKVINESR